jgi:hypothetical protein
MKVTRRALGRILAATAAVPLQAAPQGPSPDADEELKAARERLRNQAAQIARVPLLKTVEPAFRFKA